LDNIKIILVETTHPGNIGAAARAMKTMGLSHLRLVQPKLFPCAEATARAAGADDILANTQIFESYEESLRDCHLILGTSARHRSIAWPILTPKASVCHYLVQIPTKTTFSSLNVASAVQILAYELRCADLAKSPATLHERGEIAKSVPASAEEMAQFYEHLEQTLIDIDFLDPKKPRRLMRRLHRLFNRVQLIDSEVSILRGILTAAQTQCEKRMDYE